MSSRIYLMFWGVALVAITLSFTMILADTQIDLPQKASQVELLTNNIKRTINEELLEGESSLHSTPSISHFDQVFFLFTDVFDFPLYEFRCENNLTVADFDNDGLRDIALVATTSYEVQPSHSFESKLVLLHNQGDWQFSSTVIDTYTDYGYWMGSADMNADGWQDLVVLEGVEDDGTHVYLNNKAGEFSQAWMGGTGLYANDLDLADVNGDKSIDILSGEQGYPSGFIEVFLNNGFGTGFTKSWESPKYGISPGTIYDLFAANLNGDLYPDIAAIEIYTGILLSFIGDGTGSNFVESTNLLLGDRTFSLAMGDINEDGITDIATYVGWGQARVFLTGPNATVSDYWASPNLGEVAFNLSLTDFDHDGLLDLFVGTYGDGMVRIYQGNPASKFELHWSSVLPGKGHSGMPTDIDNDGFSDLIVGWEDANKQTTIRILRLQVVEGYEIYLPQITR